MFVYSGLNQFYSSSSHFYIVFLAAVGLYFSLKILKGRYEHHFAHFFPSKFPFSKKCCGALLFLLYPALFKVLPLIPSSIITGIEIIGKGGTT